jgi:hypothetical protein
MTVNWTNLRAARSWVAAIVLAVIIGVPAVYMWGGLWGVVVGICTGVIIMAVYVTSPGLHLHCPGCGRGIPSGIPACPHCGQPIER